MLINITSTKNEKYKFFKALKQKKARTESGLYTVEGIKSANDAISAGADIEAILITNSLYTSKQFVYTEEMPVYVISDEIFAGLSDTENPQGVIAVIRKSENRRFIPDLSKAYIFCDHLQDPGNLGTIIRTADAAGFGGVLLSKESVDLYSPKTVRSSMGSFFNIPRYEGITAEDLKEYKELGFSLVCGVLLDNTIEYTSADMTKPVIITVGNEANGISEEILALSDVNVKIPIEGGAESLNAAIAAAVLMYEVNRQRRAKNRKTN